MPNLISHLSTAERRELFDDLNYPETCFIAKIVRLDGPSKTLRASDRLYYGWYHKKNETLARLLGQLTGGAFLIARARRPARTGRGSEYARRIAF